MGPTWQGLVSCCICGLDPPFVSLTGFLVEDKIGQEMKSATPDNFKDRDLG